MHQLSIDFYSKKHSLIGLITSPTESLGSSPGMILCHPHPSLGGSMHNGLITSISKLGSESGIASLRFNFRGIGGSEGDFENGKDSNEDIKAAINLTRSWKGSGFDKNNIVLVGYSFGAGVILDNIKQFKHARCFILISPPISSLKNSRIQKDKRPKLFIAGQNDTISPSVEIQRELDKIKQPVKFSEIPNVDHTMEAEGNVVAEQVIQYLVGSVFK